MEEGAEVYENYNKIIHITENNTGARKELRKINNIFSKENGKFYLSSRDISRNDSNSSLSSDSEWHTEQTDSWKETIKLYHLMNNHLKYINQLNDVIENEMKFGSTSNLYRCPNNYPLPLVTVSLIFGKNFRAELVHGITFLWYISATDGMIKMKHTNPFERKMNYCRV